MVVEELKQKLILTKVKSSNILALGYNKDEEKLYIMFAKGSVYEYIPFKQAEYNDFLKSESPGKHFFAKVKSSTLLYKALDITKYDIEFEKEIPNGTEVKEG